MKISCCAYSYRQMLQDGRMTLPDFLRVCREMGCEGAELTAYYFPETSPEYLETLKRKAAEDGVTISGTAIRSEYTHPDPAKRAEDIARTKEWLALSAALGAPTMRVFAGRVHE